MAEIFKPHFAINALEGIKSELGLDISPDHYTNKKYNAYNALKRWLLPKWQLPAWLVYIILYPVMYIIDFLIIPVSRWIDYWPGLKLIDFFMSSWLNLINPLAYIALAIGIVLAVAQLLLTLFSFIFVFLPTMVTIIGMTFVFNIVKFFIDDILIAGVAYVFKNSLETNLATADDLRNIINQKDAELAARILLNNSVDSFPAFQQANHQKAFINLVMSDKNLGDDEKVEILKKFTQKFNCAPALAESQKLFIQKIAENGSENIHERAKLIQDFAVKFGCISVLKEMIAGNNNSSSVVTTSAVIVDDDKAYYANPKGSIDGEAQDTSSATAFRSDALSLYKSYQAAATTSSTQIQGQVKVADIASYLESKPKLVS
jgi:hypothetical protein